MKLKTGFLVACTIFVAIGILNVPSLFAQEQDWESCIMDAYGTDIDEELEVKTLRFTVVTPPTGSEIPNSITVLDTDTGENYTVTLSDGDRVNIIYDDPIFKRIEVAPEEDHYTVYYEGSATFISINSAVIPEFSSFLIIPMFMIIALIAIVYRRKQSAQAQAID